MRSLLTLLFVTTALPADTLRDDAFAATKSACGWTPFHHLLPPEPTTEGLKLTIGGHDPALVGPRMPFPIGEALYARVRLYSEFGGIAQLFVYDRGPTEDLSVRFEVPAGRWFETFVALPIPPAEGTVRFDPPGSGGTCTLARLTVETLSHTGVVRVAASATHLTLRIRSLKEALTISELPAESA